MTDWIQAGLVAYALGWVFSMMQFAKSSREQAPDECPKWPGFMGATIVFTVLALMWPITFVMYLVSLLRFRGDQ